MSRVAVIACGALALDVRAIARRRGWELDVHPVPALLHNRPERIPPAVAAEVERLRGRYDRIVLAYGDCGTYGGLDELCRAGARGTRRALAGEHCYDLFARDEVREAIAEEPGTYFLTDFLARTFEHTVVRELGLDRHPVAVRGVLPQLRARDLARAAADARPTMRRPPGPPTGSASRSRCGRSATSDSSTRWPEPFARPRLSRWRQMRSALWLTRCSPKPNKGTSHKSLTASSQLHTSSALPFGPGGSPLA